MSGPRNDKCVKRDEAREKASTILALLKHGCDQLPTYNEKRAFTQAVRREAKKLYYSFNGQDNEQIKRPSFWEAIPGVRDTALVLTEFEGQFIVTHAHTWIRLKYFDTKEEAIAWGKEYWSTTTKEVRQAWKRLTRKELIRIVCDEIDPSLWDQLFQSGAD